MTSHQHGNGSSQQTGRSTSDLGPSEDDGLPHNRASALHVELPEWAWAVASGRCCQTSEEQMELVLELADLNISDGGGPFAAAVFNQAGVVVGPGVNRVVPASVPTAHAEIVAIGIATQSLGTWDLRSLGDFTLVTSTEPCAMCLGAVPWSGVSGVVTGATDADARSVGFDEGDKLDDWSSVLTSRAITVEREVLRTEAAAVLRRYADAGGQIYNGS